MYRLAETLIAESEHQFRLSPPTSLNWPRLHYKMFRRPGSNVLLPH
jgi:hypothetical protein